MRESSRGIYKKAESGEIKLKKRSIIIIVPNNYFRHLEAPCVSRIVHGLHSQKYCYDNFLARFKGNSLHLEI